MYGSIYSGEFRNNEVQMEFRLSPKYMFSINMDTGVINMEAVNVTLVKRSELKILQIVSCQMDVNL